MHKKSKMHTVKILRILSTTSLFLTMSEKWCKILMYTVTFLLRRMLYGSENTPFKG